MPWKATCPVEERREFIECWLRHEEPVSELCRRFGVSRKTGYKWLGRFREGGRRGLEEQSRAPHRSPQRVDVGAVDLVLETRPAHPRWGPRKLLQAAQRRHGEHAWPSHATLSRVLRELGRSDDDSSTLAFGPARLGTLKAQRFRPACRRPPAKPNEVLPMSEAVDARDPRAVGSRER